MAFDNFYYLREKADPCIVQMSSKGQKPSAFNNFFKSR